VLVELLSFPRVWILLGYCCLKFENTNQMNYSFLRGLISTIIGAIIGTITSENVLPFSFWWVGLIVGALVGAFALNPKKFVSAVKEAFIFSVNKCFCKKTASLTAKVILLPLRLVGLGVYSVLNAVVLSSSFLVAAILLAKNNAHQDLFFASSVALLCMLGVGSVFTSIAFSALVGSATRDDEGYYIYLFSKKERPLLFLPEKKDGFDDVNTFKMFFWFFNPISLLCWGLYFLFHYKQKVLRFFMEILKFVWETSLSLFHFSIRLEQLMRKELWSVTSLSSAIGVLGGHWLHGNLLVAGGVGGLAYLIAFGVVFISASLAKALPNQFWVDKGVV
jgi:hypothetical protein